MDQSNDRFETGDADQQTPSAQTHIESTDIQLAKAFLDQTSRHGTPLNLSNNELAKIGKALQEPGLLLSGPAILQWHGSCRKHVGLLH